MKKSLKELGAKLTNDRLVFVCPTSFLDPNDKDLTGHSIIVPLTPKGTTPTIKSIWNKSGSTLEDVTLSPSVNCTESGCCKFHGWIKNGNVIW